MSPRLGKMQSSSPQGFAQDVVVLDVSGLKASLSWRGRRMFECGCRLLLAKARGTIAERRRLRYIFGVIWVTKLKRRWMQKLDEIAEIYEKPVRNREEGS